MERKGPRPLCLSLKQGPPTTGERRACACPEQGAVTPCTVSRVWVTFLALVWLVFFQPFLEARCTRRWIHGEGTTASVKCGRDRGAVGAGWWQPFRPPRAAQLCIVSDPFPRHRGTPAADTMALGFPWAGSGYRHQACRKLLLTLREGPREWGGWGYEVGEF